MNLPFAASSPVASQVPPGLGRAGTSAPSPRPAAPTVTRGHAGLRAEAAPPSVPKRSGGFASVLAAVQEHDEPSIAGPEVESRASTVDRVAASERETSDPVGESGAVEHVLADEPPAPAPAPTPWLLLSLSGGPHAWSHGSQSSPEEPGGLGGVDVAPTGGHEVAVTLADVGIIASTAPPVIVDVAMPPGLAIATGAPDASAASSGSSLPLAEGGGVGPGAAWLEPLAAHSLPIPAPTAAAVPVVAPSAVAPGADGITAPVPFGTTAESPTVAAAVAQAAAVDSSVPGAIAAVAGLETPSPRGVAAETPPTRAAAEERPAASTVIDTLGRWLTAARGTGAEVDVRLPRVAETAATPGLAVRQLADLIDAMPGAESTDAGGPNVPLTPEALLSPVSPVGTGLPTARASEVLLRLAQAGAPVSRSGRDSQTPAAMAVQMLSSALAPSPMTEAVVPPAPTAPLPPAVGDQVLQQVVQSLRMQWKDGIGEAKVHLRPDALGSVSVTLRVEGGAVTAVVRAESSQVQEWVLQHQQTLRQQLESAGLRLDELVVSPDDDRQPDHRQDAPPDQRRRARNSNADAATDSARFEGLL